MIKEDLCRIKKLKNFKFFIFFLNYFSKGDRVSLIDEGKYMGEKIPFYYSPQIDKDKEDKNDPKNQGKYGKLFFPEVIIFIYNDF